MAGGYLRYGADPRFPPAAPPSLLSSKRPRTDYPDMAGGLEYFGYYRDEDKIPHRATRDTELIGAPYDSYLRNGIYSGISESVRSMGGGISGYPSEDMHMIGVRSMGGPNVGYANGKPEKSLPQDASNTLFVEGLPLDCTRREVSHIFRPFVGFKEVRLVNKESKYPGGDPHILCFVDFSGPDQAAAALDALRGYKFDEHDRESAEMRLQFARFPGRQPGAGHRGKQR